ncbi:hypothetical protein D0C36_01065 [Mucilaginibacter conchicola]|uniref:Lipoprotein n=1 Tax=Mucilaginibacter conchicola TaxID=2303333 RepID=A0A372NVM2_9SPHI|nr:hypothetical protein [Mucilaginibacter conchicola]RFZ94178.1 hypothetical protein D0C36_01065 [Mucilaginibacter conchicola]
MKNNILPIALLILLASCGGNQSSSNTNDKGNSDTVVKTDTVSLYNEEYSTQHYFSNTQAKDNFTLKVSGSDILKSKAVLEIKNTQGDLLYQYKFTTIDLLIDAKSISADEQTKRITEIFEHYFDGVHFKIPAIDKREKFEDAFSNPNPADKPAWEEIKANQKAIRFQHREGYEGQASVAYSPLLKKAILIHYMD